MQQFSLRTRLFGIYQHKRCYVVVNRQSCMDSGYCHWYHEPMSARTEAISLTVVGTQGIGEKSSSKLLSRIPRSEDQGIIVVADGPILQKTATDLALPTTLTRWW